ncbi:riboflavin synthase [Alicyclobacillus ferrooxydans]|uniref:Riboflavin synthase n=1 Tax=Alicyclobacillus ferrooxydans TaxID=471514 RepID=A0A0P9C9W0_9BACL|nr:riboflavin synthase [Alicyclobacillus ferrooxydans]KPV42174.1 riboflavin synthase subunit alpha [Alicyclobacillus ferrooxydans]
MFTGLVEEIGQVIRVSAAAHGAHFEVRANKVLDNVQLGDSISVNGACLTVVSYTNHSFTVDAVPETLRRTTLGRLAAGDEVNLERALRLGDRLGGHIVSGHIDGVGVISQTAGEGLATVLTVQAADEVLRYIADKGSICINGVSLTVMEVDAASFSVSVIPHTGTVTTLLKLHVGDRVNLEIDVLAKYVERLLGAGLSPIETADSRTKERVTLDMLRDNGFA